MNVLYFLKFSIYICFHLCYFFLFFLFFFMYSLGLICSSFPIPWDVNLGFDLRFFFLNRSVYCNKLLIQYCLCSYCKFGICYTYLHMSPYIIPLWFLKKFYLFWLCWVFPAVQSFFQLWYVGATLAVVCGVSLQGLLLLWTQAVGGTGFSSCGSWALEHSLSRSGARA